MRRKTQDICFNGVMRLLITTKYLARDTGIWEWVSEGEDKTFHNLNTENSQFPLLPVFGATMFHISLFLHITMPPA